MHVQINARNEDDVDEAVIMEKVKNASGANYSIHKEKPKAFVPQGNIVRKNMICYDFSSCEDLACSIPGWVYLCISERLAEVKTFHTFLYFLKIFYKGQFVPTLSPVHLFQANLQCFSSKSDCT